MDTNATTTNSVNINTYTPVFKTGATVKGVKLCRMWNHDIVRYADGTIAVLGQGRADNCTGTPSGSDPDKRMIYSRFDGSSWKADLPREGWPEAVRGRGGLHRARRRSIPTTRTRSTSRRSYDPRDDTTKSTQARDLARDHLRQRRHLHVDAGDGAVDDGQHPPDRSEVGREPHGAALAERDVHERADLRDEGRRPRRAEELNATRAPDQRRSGRATRRAFAVAVAEPRRSPHAQNRRCLIAKNDEKAR